MTTEQEEYQKPIRKTPKVRQQLAVTEPSSDLPKARASKKKSLEEVAPSRKISNNSKTLILVAFAFLAGSLLTYTVTSSSNPTPAVTTSTFTDVIAGKVALSETELISAVKKLGVDVYWAGPVKDAKYTLAVPAEGQAYIRYLPNGEGLTDTKPNYVVIATYTTNNAFSATQAAGNQTNGVTFINTEGAAVYYNKETPTNVYVAYPNLNYQIEVFDPIATTALDIASKQGALRLVK